jgi:hypothetical protein
LTRAAIDVENGQVIVECCGVTEVFSILEGNLGLRIARFVIDTSIEAAANGIAAEAFRQVVFERLGSPEDMLPLVSAAEKWEKERKELQFREKLEFKSRSRHKPIRKKLDTSRYKIDKHRAMRQGRRSR